METQSPPYRFRRDTLLVFLLLAFAYGYFFHNSGWNGNSRLGTIMAVVHEHRLEIDRFHAWGPTQTSDKAEFNGHFYSDKAIGVALLGVVAYFPFSLIARLFSPSINVDTIRHYLTFVVVGLPSALAGSLFYRSCRDASGSRARALLVTLAYALGTMAFAYSALLFGHQLAASLLLVAFFLAMRVRRSGGIAGAALSFGLGLALGLSLVTDYSSLLLVIITAVYALRALRRGSAAHALKSVGIASIGALIPIGLQLANNAVCFGSPFRNAYALHAVPGYQEGIHQGIMGITLPRLDVLFYLTFHPARGLFWQSPVLLAACAGFAWMLRDRAWRDEAVVALCAAAGYLVVNSGYFCWWGGWSFGPRFLIPMLPFLAFGLVFLPARFQPSVIALAVVSALQMLVYTAQEPIIPADLTDIASRPAFHYWPLGASLGALARGRWGPNLGASVGLRGVMALAPFIAGVALLTRGILARATPTESAEVENGGRGETP